ncbi:MAG: CPBP family intramembrane metalloprotease [Anaerolineae bacterium]|nr:CPBP family intramembrane metalloprotease [Anaerolineae bacterium]
MSETQKSPASPWLFLVLVLGLSWLFWIPAAWVGPPEPAPLTLALHYAGGAMPFLVTIGFVFLTMAPASRGEFAKRIIDMRRIGWRWYLLILFLPPILTLLAGGLDALWGGDGMQPEALTRFTSAPLGILPFALFMLLFGPVPEEIAWRGYALDRLRDRFPVVAAGVLLGVIWTVWHLPLFWIEGSYQHGLGVGTGSFWLFMLDKAPQTLVMAWVYYSTQRSTLSAILLHFSVNFTGELFALTLRAETFYILLWYGAAVIAIVALVRRRDIGRPG